MKKIVIAGGSGFLGKLLTRHFHEQGHEVLVLTRKKSEMSNVASQVSWDGECIGSWIAVLEEADVLINLCGKSVDCRYTEENKQLIYDTRLKPTSALGRAIQKCKTPPKLWINASSATIYRYAEDRDMDEETGEIGNGFSVGVCKKWEKSFYDTETSNTRKVALRIAIVLGESGGALTPLKNLVKVGLGGHQGMGHQYFSWIHEEDFVRAVEKIIFDSSLNGTFNLAAPKPILNRDFMREIRQIMKAPFGLPLPMWILEIGAKIIRTETELILKSRRVVPERLKLAGFEFKYPSAQEALADLLN